MIMVIAFLFLQDTEKERVAEAAQQMAPSAPWKTVNQARTKISFCNAIVDTFS